ncbi:MAG: aldehyde-activating protein [Burkholderiales bacterium RIFCSPLOWO2_12_67_14]|nr:MAG: aldehyde-activating protein [Burkholderiales bacterium RIFCSPLOWO2_02_FULL_67_64]OGB40415.1 MAG: aldehyde-activating protein [Burkholderiales bacterium RIFCSPHIGHO2_12_FULL_67_38]OGB47101.1 MAG: aldehyde-activating protein [Burkholderiales bacterium RIFCSPLOWO2_12_67_14]OGB87668.1 MAG: aldehyde-activating protein [Burkholderiales bacterium RIFCSPLOWO2_12_FULL_67_210]
MPSESTPTPTHTGSCHCGRIVFEVHGAIDNALACNCSICSRKGSLLWFAPRASLVLKTPEDAASTYLFNKHAIRHRFCPVCGIHPYGEGTDPKGNAIAAINLRCIDGIDLAAIPVHPFDGKSL